MSDKDDVVEIDLTEDPKPKKGEGADKDKKVDEPVIVEGAAKPKDGDVDTGPTQEQVVAKLKKDVENERNGRLAAEKKARDEAAARQASESEVGTTQMQLVTTAIETTKRDTETLESNYAAALAAQDYAGAAKINTQIGAAQARLLQLENGKTAMEEEAKRAKERPLVAETNDPVEAFASQLTGPSADWIRRNPEFARNPRKNRAMIRAHEDVMDDGFDADTPEYFAEIEKKLGLGKVEQEVIVEPALSAAAAPAQRRSSPAAAPVSNSGGATGARPGRVTLTREEAEMAEASGLTAREYYDNKMALKNAGRLN